MSIPEYQLDQLLLNKRLHHFWGYGNFNASYWCVGMEEGGGSQIDDVVKRLNTWRDLGGQELIDNRDFHRALNQHGFERYFDGKIKLQRTWAKLIRLRLNIENPFVAYSANDIKHIQATQWGQLHSDSCLLDIFPLPSPTANSWHYNKWSDIPILQTRQTYKSALKESRTSSLKGKIKKFKPQIVHFYGMSHEYLKIWEAVAQVEFDHETRFLAYKNKHVFIAQNDATAFVVTYQPNAVWNNEYWNNAGKLIHQFLGSNPSKLSIT